MKQIDFDVPATLHPELGLWMGALADSTREWKENLGSPSVDAIVWQARSEGPSIGAVLLHMIDAEAYWFETRIAKKQRPRGEVKLLLVEETKLYSGKWPAPPAEPIEWYFDLFERVRSRAWAAIAGADPAAYVETKNYRFSIRWILAHVLQHDSYHGGQAVLLHEMWKSRL